jgi:hypothetical protein
MKVCNVCTTEKKEDQYQKYNLYKGGLHPTCKSCLSVKKAQDYKDRWFIYQARLKKAESKRKGIPYDLTPEYLESIWTDKCPVFEVLFVRFDKSHSHSPTLDRVDPSKGYVKGNVKYICARANRIKYDATPEELLLVLDYMGWKDYNPQTSTSTLQE